MSSPSTTETQAALAAGEDVAEVPGISQAQFDNYDKPKTPLPTILEELIQASPFGQLDVQEIYIELRARYPYFRVHAEPQVWQVRRRCKHRATCKQASLTIYISIHQLWQWQHIPQR